MHLQKQSWLLIQNLIHSSMLISIISFRSQGICLFGLYLMFILPWNRWNQQFGFYNTSELRNLEFNLNFPYKLIHKSNWGIWRKIHSHGIPNQIRYCKIKYQHCSCIDGWTEIKPNVAQICFLENWLHRLYLCSIQIDINCGIMWFIL